MFLSITWLTQLLKMRLDLAFQHSHRAANVLEWWQLTAFRLPSHRPLADAKDFLQFREPD
jgi:hypothetical protein